MTTIPLDELEARLRKRKAFWQNGATWMMSTHQDLDCTEAADAIAALRRERDEARCPIGLDDAREICSAGCCRPCLSDRLSHTTSRAEAAERLADRYKALAEGERAGVGDIALQEISRQPLTGELSGYALEHVADAYNELIRVARRAQRARNMRAGQT